MRVFLSSSIIIGALTIAGTLIASKFDITLPFMSGLNEELIQLELELQEWRSHVEGNRKLTESVARLKNKYAEKTGRELHDHKIIRAMRSAKARAPKRFSPGWLEQFKDYNPPLGFPGHVDETDLEVKPQNKRRGQVIERVEAISISALSPGFPWNGHLRSTPEDFRLYCAGVTLQEPVPGRNAIRPHRGQDLEILDCLENFVNNRTLSQVLLQYTDEGELNFTLISERDPYADPYGWCVGVGKVKKNKELVADYCDPFAIEQVWRIIPTDNTWRPEAQWYDVSQGYPDGGLCVEVKNSTLSEGVDMHLRPCTYHDTEARQRQTWIYCYQATECDTDDSVPPDFTLEVECEETDVVNSDPSDSNTLVCDESSLTLNTGSSNAGAVPEGFWDELNDCNDDPVDDKRFGSSLVYRVTKEGANDDDKYLVFDLESECDDDGDDADTYLRVYEEQSDGEWDCRFVGNTFCQDGINEIQAVVDPDSRDHLVIVSNDGVDTEREQVDFRLDMDCFEDRDDALIYAQVQLRENTDLCLGVDDTDTGTNLELFDCDNPGVDDDNLLWALDDNRLLHVKAGNNRCARINGGFSDGTRVDIASCNEDNNKQTWRYDNFGDNEISSVGNSNFCMTYDLDVNNPSTGDRIEIEECNEEEWQEWQSTGFSTGSVPSPSPPDDRDSDDLYCYATETGNTEEDLDVEDDLDGDFDENSCRQPSDSRIFDDDSNLKETYRIIDTAGIKFDLIIKSLCNGDAGEGDNQAETTLYRLYVIQEDNNGLEYDCRAWEQTTCDDGNSNDEETVRFDNLTELRYLLRVTNAIIDVNTCEVNDDCTRPGVFEFDEDETAGGGF